MQLLGKKRKYITTTIIHKQTLSMMQGYDDMNKHRRFKFHEVIGNDIQFRNDKEKNKKR